MPDGTWLMRFRLRTFLFFVLLVAVAVAISARRWQNIRECNSLIEKMENWTEESLGNLSGYRSTDLTHNSKYPSDENERAFVQYSGEKKSGEIVEFRIAIYLMPLPSMSRPKVICTRDTTNREMDWAEFTTFLRDEVGANPPDF